MRSPCLIEQGAALGNVDFPEVTQNACALTMEQRLAFGKNITGRASTTRWRAEADALAARGSPCRKGAIFLILELDQPFTGQMVAHHF